MIPYRVTLPTGDRVPILLSVPHCGTAFPDDLVKEFKPGLDARGDDADWFVDDLYDFAPAMGITMISSVYHRWVIDLNRAPDDRPLYSDGRIITGLCPTTDFLGNNLYADDRTAVNASAVQQRLHAYYEPYHNKLGQLITEIHRAFGSVLVWECHSIRQYVPTIYPDKFPDLILGDADGTSAAPALIKVAYDALHDSAYNLSHNFPFKGGYITRAYGQPLHNNHALQLEMTKINYMDDRETKYDPSRANTMRMLLQKTLSALAAKMLSRQ